MEDHLSGKEDHRQALARTLRVPHDAALLFSFRFRGFDDRPHGATSRMELMISSDLLHDNIAVAFEDNEMTDQIEEPFSIKDAFD